MIRPVPTVFSACVGVAVLLASCGGEDPPPAYCKQFVGEMPIECQAEPEPTASPKAELPPCGPDSETEGCDDVEASED